MPHLEGWALMDGKYLLPAIGRHELIALESPFPHVPLAVAAPGVPAALDALVNQMLESEPALRPPCAAEVGARLAAIARNLQRHH